MKNAMTYVFTAAAVAMALISCTKEISTDKQGNKDINPDGTRTLVLSYANVTKTTLSDDGISPMWAEGDNIFLADGTSTETYTVTSDQGGLSSITITTTLKNTVTAVYPADAAIEKDNTITGVKVKAEQDSTFASANICMAEESQGTLAFQNKTAVFKVKVPAHTAQLVVTSLGEIDGTTGQRGSTVRPINTDGVNDAAKQKITVNLDNTKESPTTCYVAVLVDAENPVLLANLNFDAVASATAGAQGGFAPNYLKYTKNVDPSNLKVAVNTIYTLHAESLHPYVAFDMTVGSVTKTYKWATLNVGATAEEPNGDYFAWGEINGHKPNLSAEEGYEFEADFASFDFSDGRYNQDTKTPSAGFDDCNAPYYDGNADYSTSKYNNQLLGKTLLDLCDDAANANWGGSWRMPKKEEFIALLGGSDESTYTPGDDNSFAINGITFQASDYGDGTGLEYYDEPGDYGYYCSASLNEGNMGGVWRLDFYDGDASVWYTGGRCDGYSVRPLSE